MVDETERALLDTLLYEEDDLEVRLGAVRSSSNPFFLNKYAVEYNWDDGTEIPQAIADHECCDLGTALALFWRADGISVLQGEVQRTEHNGDHVDLCRSLIKRLERAEYKLGPTGFDPEVNRVWAYKYEKAGISPVFYQEVIGLVVQA